MTVIASVWFVFIVSVLTLVAVMKSSFRFSRWGRFAGVITTLVLLGGGAAFAQPAAPVGGEANLQLPDLTQVQFLGMNGHQLLMWGPAFCVLGMIFGLVIYFNLKKMPAHKSMLEVSELIWETCKTYLIHQGKFLMLLWSFIAVVILAYFAVLLHFSASESNHHSCVQYFGNGGQLFCGVVWYPRQHAGKFARCLCIVGW